MVRSGAHSNGSNLQGLDDPLERSNQSSVSFNSEPDIHYFVDDASSTGMTALDMDQIVEETITQQMADAYRFDCCIFRDCSFHTIRSAARILSSMTYETQSGVDNIPPILPPICYDQRGNIKPRCLNAFNKAKKAYDDFWNFPAGISPTYDFVGAAVAVAPEPTPPPEIKPSDTVPPTDPNKPKSRKVKYESQSGELVKEKIATGDKVLPLTTFSDDTTDVESMFLSSRDDTFYLADTADTSPAKFFARPVSLGTYSWQVGTPFSEVVINPFALFWANKKVVNRVAHHRLMKCDMCVKILINGTPFHYGMLLASVHHNESWDALSPPPSPLDAFNIGKSQRPHVYLDPTTSQGGCLRLPFINQRNAFDMGAVDTLLGSTIHISQMVLLRHVSGIVEPITVSVMGWAENVVLSGPTMFPSPALVPQSGDEYGDGIVSRPAYILAKIAGSLSQVPHIGPYAMASSIGAMKIGNVAKIFGFSKPNIVTDTMFMKPRTMCNLSSTNAHDPIFKATFDDKAEVTVDPRVVGAAGEDEMTIASIVTRESYLTQFLMAQGALSGTRLFQIVVAPTLYNLSTPAPIQTYHMTPMCWAAQPFSMWRGTLRYRFRVVSSSFHRGRIRIVYEPKNVQSTLLSEKMVEHNVQHTYVWDLAESKEAVIDVGWHTHQPYLEIPDITSQVGPNFPFAANPTSTANLSFLERETNGSLSLMVMNELTAPNVNLAADVTILVSVSALEDMEFANPSPAFLNSYNFTPQSGEIIEDSKFMPVANQAHVMFGKSCKDNRTAAIHYGDPVTSVRSLLKRYMHTITMGNAEFDGIITYLMPSFPLYPGKVPGAIHLNGASAFNYTTMTHMNWFTPAYLCRRGGIRVRAVPLSTYQRNQIISRRPTNTGVVIVKAEVGLNNTDVAKQSIRDRFVYGAGWSGSQMMADPGAPLDMEIPYHSPLRYSNARTLNNSGGSVVQMGYSITTRTKPPIGGIGYSGYDVFISAADDFSLSVFVCVPPIYRAAPIV